MNGPPPSLSQKFIEAAAIAARWLVGAWFVHMGLNKTLDPVAFLKLVRQYDIVHSSLTLNSIAAALPWFEIFCGLLLVLGIAVRGAALVTVGMLIPFTLAVLQRALAIYHASQIAFCAIKFDCGCGNGEEFICHKLIENGLLIAASLWLLSGRGRQLCARYSLA